MKVRACVLWAFGTLTSAPAALRGASQQFLIAQGWRGDRLGKGCAYGFSKGLVTSVLVCLRSLLVMWTITSLQDHQFPFNDGMISLHYHDDSDVWTKVHHEELGQDGQVEATLKVATGAPGKRKVKVGWDSKMEQNRVKWNEQLEDEVLFVTACRYLPTPGWCTWTMMPSRSKGRSDLVLKPLKFVLGGPWRT